MPHLPADEYDSYAPRLAALVEMKVSDQAIANHLEHLERTEIGIVSGRDLLGIAAQVRAAVLAASRPAT